MRHFTVSTETISGAFDWLGENISGTGRAIQHAALSAQAWTKLPMMRQKDLVAALVVQQRMVTRWENDEAAPRRQTLEKIQEALSLKRGA